MNFTAQHLDKEGLTASSLPYQAVTPQGKREMCTLGQSFDDSSTSSEDSVDAAILLTAMKTIASREMCDKSSEFSKAKVCPTPHHSGLSFAELRQSASFRNVEQHSLRRGSATSESSEGDIDSASSSSQSQKSSELSRMRAVSFDNGNLAEPQAFLDLTLPLGSSSPRSGAALMTHEDEQEILRTPISKRRLVEGRNPAVVTPKTKKAKMLCGPSGPKTTILRRKFSWKNYPELEEFLIANREEYLRHSTLNYTVQQKQFNNRLTERLIELAEEHSYQFDPSTFTFVAIRDRIRCYFKSYVQSSKKRGLIIGYAAKRAGLISDRDLEDSANQAGKIVVPS